MIEDLIVYMSMVRDAEFGVVTFMPTLAMSEDDEATLQLLLETSGYKDFHWWPEVPPKTAEGTEILQDCHPRASMVKVLADTPRLTWECPVCRHSYLRIHNPEVVVVPDCPKCQTAKIAKVSVDGRLLTH